ncbi:MAG: hypothetical protein MI867_10125, partial [Pseudomonadales bacterium]|nr:hypothetical protein [Pseudomonadales bacterium]
VASHGLLFSQSIDLSTGAFTGVKLDLCGHCLRYEENQWIDKLSHLPEGMLLKNAQVFFEDLKNFWRCGLDVAFVSLGIDTYGKSRCNLYWKIR